MNTLFPLVNELLPPGFIYEENFISRQQETDLVKLVEQMELKNLAFQGYQAKRKVASFGFDWSFDSRRLTKGKDIPFEFSSIVGQVSDYLNVSSADLAEVLVTEYPAGSVINWHRDAPPFDMIVGLSLLSDCLFKLRPYDKSKQLRKNALSVPVKPRSLYVLKGPCRSDWEHSIAPVKSKRYSITFRTLK
jgi:alkylated DNA repair dioxygenase AlkB